MTVAPPPPPSPAPSDPAPPSLFRLATVLGQRGLSRIRHPGEVPFVIIGGVLFVANWVAIVILAILSAGSTRLLDKLQAVPLVGAYAAQLLIGVLSVPLLYLIYRGINYGAMRVNSVRMSPTQFPAGYRMVVEAATAAGLRRVPDAYVQLGNGTINAFSAGHGFRRYIVVYSDLFEVGGAARDPAALRFVIGHEVGHLAAGHVGYFRLLVMSTIMQIPVLGSALSRAQEYTADNFGYRYAADGGTRAMRVLAAGKYLNAQVRVDEFADRATIERGPFVWLANLLSSHPVLTWRTHALRDRSRPGRLFFRPRFTPSAQPSLLSGSAPSRDWPDPSEGDAFLASYPAENPSQFGVFPPVGGDLPADGEYGRAELRHGWRRALPPYGGPSGPYGGPSGPYGGPSGPYGGPSGPGGWPPADPSGYPPPSGSGGYPPPSGPGGYPPAGPGTYPPSGGLPPSGRPGGSVQPDGGPGAPGAERQPDPYSTPRSAATAAPVSAASAQPAPGGAASAASAGRPDDGFRYAPQPSTSPSWPAPPLYAQPPATPSYAQPPATQHWSPSGEPNAPQERPASPPDGPGGADPRS